jgi:hypothetical protein
LSESARGYQPISAEARAVAWTAQAKEGGTDPGEQDREWLRHRLVAESRFEGRLSEISKADGRFWRVVRRKCHAVGRTFNVS